MYIIVLIVEQNVFPALTIETEANDQLNCN